MKANGSMRSQLITTALAPPDQMHALLWPLDEDSLFLNSVCKKRGLTDRQWTEQS